MQDRAKQTSSSESATALGWPKDRFDAADQLEAARVWAVALVEDRWMRARVRSAVDGVQGRKSGCDVRFSSDGTSAWGRL